MTKPQERQALYPGTEVPGLYGPIPVSARLYIEGQFTPISKPFELAGFA